ncbi:MAG: peptidoglycan DD-metalloendopeptidase family protein [Pseudomonadota bacterium]
MAVRTDPRQETPRFRGLALVTLGVVACAAALGAAFQQGWLPQPTFDAHAPVEQTPLTIQYAYFSPPQVRMPAEDASLDQPPDGRAPVAEPSITPLGAGNALPDEAARLLRMASLRALTAESRARTLVAALPAPASAPLPSELAATVETTAPEAPAIEPVDAEPRDQIATLDSGNQIATITVRSGDTFSDIADGLGIPQQDISLLLKTTDVTEKLNRLRPGEQLVFELGTAGELLSLSYELDKEHRLKTSRSADGFIARKESLGFDKRLMQAAGRIENSIFLAASNAGVSDALIMQVADIFKWDVDFAMDIRPGDTFKIVYEGLFADGDMKRTGRVVAVELSGRAKAHRAFFYHRDGYKGAYYTEDGRSLEKQFLRNPLEVVRITSKFDLRRRHPVLNTIRAHKGVDYGAASGTPIFATGRGKVTFIGGKGGYGKTIILQHGRKYSTLYAHMSRFRKGLKLGDRVEQGQVIGYVGKTGLATGPHLHYEFRVNGQHKDPQTVEFPGAESLPKTELARFKAQSEQPRYALNALQLPTVALAD